MPQTLDATATGAHDRAYALTRAMTATVAQWAPTLDSAIAEALIDALVLNGIRPLHHVTAHAEIFVWRARGGQAPAYVACVEGPYGEVVYTWTCDAQPATLEALSARLFPPDDRA